jgi:excisionase family DNA binding protein
VNDTPILLTVAEAAARLRIGRTTVYSLIKTGELASVTVGRLRRIRPADLAAYAAGLTPAAGPLSEAA